MFPASLRIILGPLAIAAALLTPAVAACPEEKVQVTVLAVLATDKNKDVDPLLVGLAETVKKKYPGLTGFRLEKTNRRSLQIGKEYKIPLVDKEVVTVTVERGADKNNRVELTVHAQQLGQIGYTCCCGKYLPIWTDYKNDKQETLIVAVMVEPCKK